MRSDFGNYEEEILGKPYDVKLIKRLFPLVIPYRVLFLCSIFIVILITLLDLSIPYITKVAIDRYIVPTTNEIAHSKQRYLKTDITDNDVKRVVQKYNDLFEIKENYALICFDKLSQVKKEDIAVLRKTDLKGVSYATALLFVVVCFNYILNFIQMILMEYTGQNIMHDLRMRIFKHLQKLSISFFTRNPVGRLVTRTTNDVQNMHEMFTTVFTFIFKDVFLFMGVIIVLLAINWKLALVTFIIIPFVLGVSFYFARVARGVYRILRIKIAEINTRFSETIQGIRVIKLFNQEKENYLAFERLNNENYLAAMKQVHVFAIYMPMVGFLGSIALALVIFYGGWGVIMHTVSIGTLAAFISYVRMFFRPVRDMAEKFNIMQNALASAERIFLILDSKDLLPPPVIPTFSSQSANEPLFETIENIQFSDVSFAYLPTEPVLEKISFSVKKGETVAIVGPTGAGKTTLINLILRFYDPTSGIIRINNRDIKKTDESTVRSKMALVMQDPFLFSESVRYNIAFGNKKISDNSLDSILTSSNSKYFIDRMPDGIETVLSEGGTSVSSGERQLISIARAFAKDPDLIIFDEATSYIDSDTEQKIQLALINLMRNRTTILVAHRLSTVRNADRIIVLNKGKILETGSYDELMKKKGFYYKLTQF